MSSVSAETPLSARERILSVAGRLFYRDGYRATGIDRVIAEAEVAKATFYKHFSSKDDLIVAWIARSEARALAHAPALDGPTPLTDYALSMIAIAARPDCLGCTYQATAAEFGAADHPAHVAARGVELVIQVPQRRGHLAQVVHGVGRAAALRVDAFAAQAQVGGPLRRQLPLQPAHQHREDELCL
jgi:AcrR family transcriptional regulator